MLTSLANFYIQPERYCCSLFADFTCTTGSIRPGRTALLVILTMSRGDCSGVWERVRGYMLKSDILSGVSAIKLPRTVAKVSRGGHILDRLSIQVIKTQMCFEWRLNLHAEETWQTLDVFRWNCAAPHGACLHGHELIFHKSFSTQRENNMLRKKHSPDIEQVIREGYFFLSSEAPKPNPHKSHERWFGLKIHVQRRAKLRKESHQWYETTLSQSTQNNQGITII